MSIQSEVHLWQQKIESIALNMPEDDMCPKCGVAVLQGLQKICIDCQKLEKFEARKIFITNNIHDILKEKGVKKRHLNCSFENFIVGENQKAFSFLRSITRNLTDSVLIFSATPGTGKTHLATSTIRRILLCGYEDVLFVTSPDIFLEIKTSYDPDSITCEKQVIDKYCSIGFLIIDDIGVEKVSSWAMQIWYMIISRREAEMKPTLYTSNLTLGDIKESLGSRISSRLSGGYVFELQGDDYRLNSRNKTIKKGEV